MQFLAEIKEKKHKLNDKNATYQDPCKMKAIFHVVTKHAPIYGHQNFLYFPLNFLLDAYLLLLWVPSYLFFILPMVFLRVHIECLRKKIVKCSSTIIQSPL